jgi:hypothetical protein
MNFLLYGKSNFCEETSNKIRVFFGKECILTSNESGRGVVIEDLKPSQTLSEKSFLLPRQEMSAVNHTTVKPAFNELMQTTGPDGMKRDGAVFLVIDATPYTKKATEGLPLSSPKLMLGIQSMLCAESGKRFVSLIQTQTC